MAQKFTLVAYLGTVSIAPQDQWVVCKMLAKEAEEERTDKEWKKVLAEKCKGVKINNK